MIKLNMSYNSYLKKKRKLDSNILSNEANLSNAKQNNSNKSIRNHNSNSIFSLNNFVCKEHGIHKNYNKFCLDCNKDICSWCKNHEKHKTINYEEIEIKEEEFNSLESAISERKKQEKEIKDKKAKIKKYKKNINELNEFLNDISKKIEKINNENKNFIESNNKTIECYKNGQINYNILSTLRNFNPDNKINNNINALDFNKLDKLIKNFSNEDYINMWISENYCSTWGIKEAIREFIQNQYDGIIKIIKTKKNLKVKSIGEKHNINGIFTYLDFDFLKNNELTIYGKIRYDEENKTLTISNKGKLYLGNFLLGSLKEEIKNPELIGKFGEGMKLAILALCRKKKDVIIISANKKFSFIIKEDFNFLQNNQPQKCLHCKIENFQNNNIDDNIEVTIQNINKDEWGENIKNYLWLVEDNIDIYTSIDKYGNEIGQIIFENYLKNKIFVKGIFIQDVEKDDKDKDIFIPGINTDSLNIDRDRNCIQSYSQLKRTTANVISNMINKNINYFQKNKNKSFNKTKYGYEEIKKEEKAKTQTNNNNSNIIYNKYYKNNYFNNKAYYNKKIINDDDYDINIYKNYQNQETEDISEISELSELSKEKDIDFKKLPDIVIKILTCENINYINSSTFSDYISEKTIELFWKKLDSIKEHKGKQPIDSEQRDSIDQFIKTHNLPNEFYQYYIVNKNLMDILEKSKNYISIEDKFNKYLNDLKDIIPDNDYKEALNDVYSKIKIKKKDFSEKDVIFKDFLKEDKDFCYYYNKIIYFSGSKLKEKISEKWKFWIFIKILNALQIKIEDSYEYFNEVFGIKNF